MIKTKEQAFDKTICGIGYYGLTKNGELPICSINGKMTREYQVWHGMLERCYSEKFHEKHPTYKNCTVCERWLCYANFLEDLPLIEGYEFWRDNPNQRIALDKDLKQPNITHKIYSLETCVFITIKNNMSEAMHRKHYNKKVIVAVEIETEKIVGIYRNRRDAFQQLGIYVDISFENIGKMLKGVYNGRPKKYTFIFKSEEELQLLEQLRKDDLE